MIPKWERFSKLFQAQMRKHELLVIFVNSDWIARRLRSQYPNLRVKIVNASIVKEKAVVLEDKL